jgi:predicted O-methyltransferase YrrM
MSFRKVLGDKSRAWREPRRLQALPSLRCDTSQLASASHARSLLERFRSAEADGWWTTEGPALDALNITDAASGVNSGDRRAIYTLTRLAAPGTVLEIGTHIGASTVHFAAALRQTGGRLVTVDVEDVNETWVKYGSMAPPAELATRVGGRVEFLEADSLDYMHTTGERFDLVFLDGNHDADAVYQEVPAALRLLHRGGLILLHDYFPRAAPLWSNGAVIRGPWLATERLRREGASFTVIPLGELPWPTKLGSNVTSLALLSG